MLARIWWWIKPELSWWQVPFGICFAVIMQRPESDWVLLPAITLICFFFYMAVHDMENRTKGVGKVKERER